MAIDEAGLRSLLGRLEGPPEPPSTVNLAQALAAGRQKLRRRRLARTGTSLLAAFTATAIAVPVIGWLSHPAGPSGPWPVTGPAPRSFNPLRPYAYFARPSASALQTVLISTATAMEFVVGGRSSAPQQLVVLSARQCQLAGPLRYQYRTRPGGPLKAGLAPQSIRCSSPASFGGISRTPLIARAPSIGRANAYWINNLGNSRRDALAWQYAPRGWAFMTTTVFSLPDAQAYYFSRSMKKQLYMLAAGVRFGGSAPLRFPFRLTRVPAGWGIYQVSTEHMPTEQRTVLALGPAGGRSADLAVTWYRPSQGLNTSRGCGSASPVHLRGGVTGYLYVTAADGQEKQMLCVPGLRPHVILYIYLTFARRASAETTSGFRFRNAMAVFKYLRFPRETTHPLG